MGSGVLERYLRRAIERERARRRFVPLVQLAIDLALYTFLEQRAFIEDLADQVVALCGRRAGKSSAARLLLVKTALERAGTISVLVTITRGLAKRLYWRPLHKLLRELGVPFESHATELWIRLANGSEIRLTGAKDAAEIEKLRGDPYALVVVDEAQGIRDDLLRLLVEDVLQWALVDHRGRLVVIGTPPLVPVGWFVERYQGRDAKGRPIIGWSRHHWTLFQNTKMPGGQAAVAAYLEKLRRERGISEGSPTWRREVLGELVLDTDQLVLSAFDLVDSVYYPGELPEGRPTVVEGIDVGWQHSDAIVALGRYPKSNDLWVVEEWEKNHQTEEQLAAEIKGFDGRWHPIRKVIDTGGNAKTAKGIEQRLGTELEPANKPGIIVQFQRLNDEFRARGATGKSRLRVPAGGYCARDAVRLAWAPGKIGQEIAKEPHSNALPALSYGYSVASRYFRPEPEPEVQLTPEELAERARLERYSQPQRPQ